MLSAILSFEKPKLKNVIDTLTWTAFLFHTLGVAWRIYIDGRPPVTNLYTSAIFVGWASMGIALMMKRFDRSSIVSLSGVIMAYITLSVAHYLSIGGDTIEQLRAVLNSNFWLSTHVVTIALGYALALLVGTISCIYVLLVIFKRLKSRYNVYRTNYICVSVRHVTFGVYWYYLGWYMGRPIMGAILGLGP